MIEPDDRITVAEALDAGILIPVGDNGPPWPVLPECVVCVDLQGCPQCDGSHDHNWVAWREPDPAVLGYTVASTPVRCRTCGARKCDTKACMLPRHHGGPHELY